MALDRRGFLRRAGPVALAAGALAACKPAPTPTAGKRAFDWRLATSWPAGFPGLGEAAERLADAITRGSAGQLRVTVHAGGELVPPFGVFDAAAKGDVEMGHSASYYWRAKSEAMPFFASVPFGLTAAEMNGWLYHGGGMELWRELYEGFDLVPFAAGNTGLQLAGWFNREVNSPRDLQGLRMRIPGLGGEVLARAGAQPVEVPGAGLYTAMKDGAIDACEWLGPFNDLQMQLFRAAKYCYYPGWHEPGTTIECFVNRKAWDALPDELQAVVAACCQAANLDLHARYVAADQQARETLATTHKVQFRRLPASVLTVLRKEADALLGEIAARDPFTRRVHESWLAFRDRARAWHAPGEVAYYEARA
jgi:TRAP-type mannitol/chloroaromatic compound transport system substrate-binding protein